MDIDYVNFRWLENNRDDFGFIAQQIQTVAPEIVRDVAGGYLGYDAQSYTHLIGHAVQQLNQKSNNLADRVNLMDHRITYEINEIRAISSNALSKTQELERRIEELENEIEILKSA